MQQKNKVLACGHPPSLRYGATGRGVEGCDRGEIVGVLPPHPDPLPWGEGETLPASGKNRATGLESGSSANCLKGIFL
jgi:hypothetical protein